MKTKYDEIMNLPHHVSDTRPQMPMSDRAAQFAPFAALSGYDDAIKETGRITDDKLDLDENELNILDMKFHYLREHLEEESEITFMYFEQDRQKSGGSYTIVTGVVKRIDEYERCIVLHGGIRLAMDNILNMEGGIFSEFE